MGRKRGDGVEVRKSSIRLVFLWRGARRHEKFEGLDPNKADHRDQARRIAAKIRTLIENDLFDEAAYAKYFPKSEKVKPEPAKAIPLFTDHIDTFASTLLRAASTKADYLSSLRGYWSLQFEGKRLDEITTEDIKAAVVEMADDELSGRTINNRLTPLRLMFRDAVKLLQVSPADGIGNVAYQPPEPDPFDAKERDKILAYGKERWPAEVHAYYLFAFYTGVRPSEEIALRWSDIDWNRGTAHIHRARVAYKDKGTKTNKGRFIDLTDGARDALKAMKPITQLKGLDHPVFVNPRTGERWASARDLASLYFLPAQRALGMRQRIAYHTRHTYATIALMGGANIAYISKQLGHAKVSTTLTHYAHWINGADGGAEARKLNDILSGNLVPTDSPNEKQA